VVERGAEFILPGYETMEALAARFGIPLALKGTPYGRRVPVGGEAVSEAGLDAAFGRLASGVRAGAASAAEAISALDLDPNLAAVIRTRADGGRASKRPPRRPAGAVLRIAARGYGRGWFRSQRTSIRKPSGSKAKNE
jgi:hypothetical protein